MQEYKGIYLRTNKKHTPGNVSFCAISWKSLFLSLTCDWPAAKWEHTKQSDVLWYMNRTAIPPLLPVAPPSPVFTLSSATSLETDQSHYYHRNMMSMWWKCLWIDTLNIMCVILRHYLTFQIIVFYSFTNKLFSIRMPFPMCKTYRHRNMNIESTIILSKYKIYLKANKYTQAQL